MLLKRCLDVFLSLFLILILFPFMALLLFFVLFFLGSPVLFKQKRPGKDEKIFTIYKFRTMTDAKDENGNLLADEIRLTRFGKFSRSTSLDELPQLFNVLKGDMSFVGPRALLVEYLPRYTKEQRRRHSVKPGITGWAQVNGRNALSWEDKFDLDIWYVDHQSFWLDLNIMWMTIVKVLKRSDIDAQDGMAMPRFLANKSEKKRGG